ncbi:AAA family ATPase [Mucilaginibacter sp. P25]|uniref:HRDC domain-containing protein n=1 Tax=Mucilaginibacter gossypii TaxID=551996 RepID=A0A1G8C515_9SPHI|nr:HRDC domain-containing protein [Mucilaginibacter gossypii]SDH40587.1 HRDC domain-containing protein [Mucilaginibacter gossypii]
MVLEPFHELVLKFIENTNRPIFLTGKAGTGKTTFLRWIRANVTKNLAVVAPTAVAAINAGGVTIHSFFQVPFGPQVPVTDHNNHSTLLRQVSLEKSNILKCLDLLIIDEISMVRADTLDYIDTVLRQVKGSTRPFGGVQLLMIGDLFQLPPVYEKDWPVLRNFYKGPYFFDSLAFQKFPVLTFELTQVYRQKDPVFVEILNSIRNGYADSEMLDKLNAHYNPNLNANWLKDYVTLSTHNQLVNEINQQRLTELDGEAHTFKATITGDFPKEVYPAEEELVLKVGAQVMFIKNDSSGKKQYYNGRTGRIAAMGPGNIRLTFLDDDSEFEVIPETWQNVKYALAENEQKVNEQNNGSFSQYPLRLAWAITIHKSQGLTFEKAVIDVDAAFAFGQAYVALSRCRSLEGMILKSPVRPENIRTDPEIISFMQNAAVSIPDENLLESTIRQIALEEMKDIFDFSMLTGAWRQLKAIMLNGAIKNSPLSETINKTDHNWETEIKTIGDRFIRKELGALPDDQLIWNNAPFISRLKNAASYFLPKLNVFSEAINSFYTAVNNTNPPAEFYDSLNHLLVNLKAKTAAFVRLPIATSGRDVLSSVQEAGMSYKPVYKNWNPKALPKEKEIANPELYKQLLNWRKETSLERKIPEHTLVSENMLRDITAKLPRSLNQLSQLKSFGDAKATDLGEPILKMIRSYLGENDLFS